MEKSGTGMRLLKKGQSGIRLLFGRMGVAILLLLGQFLLLLAVFAWFEDYVIHYYGGSVVIGIVMVLHLMNKTMEPTIRTSWIVLVMVSPVFGSLMYLFVQLDLGQRLLSLRTAQCRKIPDDCRSQDHETFARLQSTNAGAASMCGFVTKANHSAVYQDTRVTYLPTGETKWERMLQELEKAEKFIYMEYFIISEGVMWGKILDVLARKAKEGVDVRVMYDGACEFILLPKNYPSKMEKLGIKTKVFSPFKPFVSTHYNYRDHRKILVIDGHTAFNGGINLSDEYINIGCRFGQWKDTALLLQGPAVQGFTQMFLQMWNLSEKTMDYRGLKENIPPQKADGFVMPFADQPLDEVGIGRGIYSDMLNRATESVRIMTPYLILDAGMEYTLRYCAARGVKIQLLLPGIPDKYVPYALAKTHYRSLLNSGVEIYEYTPGFVHGKVVSVDGREAVVGTINFDYRSFCHHYECGTYLYGVDCIRDIDRDFDECLRRSRRVTEETIRKEKWHRRLVGYVLKVFSPLL